MDIIKNIDFYKLGFDEKTIIRQEPSGSTIVTPGLYASFFWVDKKTTKSLLNNDFSQVSTKDLVRLYQSGIIIENNNNYVKTFKVDNDLLPSQVLLEATSNCDCDCKACYHKKDLNKGSPSKKDLLERVDKLCDLGLMVFEVTGGEPLLRNDLQEILKRIDNNGRNYYIVTNGGQLKNKNEDFFKTLKNSLGLAVSIDGYGKNHDKIRKRKGLFDDLLIGLEKLCENNIPEYLVTTLGDHNYSDVPKLINLAKNFNTTLHLRPAIKTGNAVFNKINSKDAHIVLKQYLSNKHVRNGFLATKKTIPESRWYGCGIRKRISIDVKGYLYPCVMDRNSKLGNLNEYIPERVISDLLEETEKFLIPLCEECDINKDEIRCGGFCRFSYSHQNETTK